MEIPPSVHFAERDGGSIAYEIFGDGTDHTVAISDVPSHLDLIWTDSSFVDVLSRWAVGRRVLMYDRRGTGLSDPLARPAALEDQALDLEAVLDAAEIERATLFGWAGSVAVAAYYAATRPKRVERLILLFPWARRWDSAYPGWPDEEREATRARLDAALKRWGDGSMLAFMTPRLATPRNRRLFAMIERASASPPVARTFWDTALGVDLTEILPSVSVPTLVLHHPDTPVPLRVCREVAELVPAAQLREVDYVVEPHSMGDFWDPLLSASHEWLTGAPLADAPSRIVATLLFTDVVGSTERVAELGDAAWRALLARHDDLLRDEVESRGGRVVKNIGDGSLSIFDGPVQAVGCALSIRETMAALGLEIRAGVHTGECEQLGLDVAGLAVHVGARVEATAGPGEVLVTQTACDLAKGSGLAFAPRGSHSLKGVPGDWALFAAAQEPAEPSALPPRAAPRLGDRAVLATARRAPGLLRALGRIGRRSG